MKKIFTTLLALTSSVLVFGQSLHIFRDKADITNSIITIPVAAGTESATELTLLNTTDKNVMYQVNRTILNPPFNDSCASLYFCSGTACYPPYADITWTPKTAPISLPAHGEMPNGNGSYGISAHYDVCENACNDLYVYYRVYNTGENTKDTAHVTIKYTCSNGILDQSKIEYFLSDAFPNPAQTNFSISYSITDFSKSKLIIQNVIGEKTQEITLHAKQNVITVNTEGWSPGIYLCSLFTNGQRLSSKKIIIN